MTIDTIITNVSIEGEELRHNIFIDEQGNIIDVTPYSPGATMPAAFKIYDAQGLVALPGLVDLHVHLRDPQRNDAENIETGSRAAAAGGFTAIFAMANTDPAQDNALVCNYVYETGRAVGLTDVYPVGAVTQGLQGKKLSNLSSLHKSKAAIRFFSDDGACVHDPLLMRQALQYVRTIDGVIAQHAQEPRLSIDAAVHDGPTAARLGLIGWPRSAEDVIIARDIILAQETGARVHVCHISSAGGVNLVRQAKKHGVKITAEVTPHHLTLTDEVLEDYDTMFKVFPPLREQNDLEVLREGLLDGTIDIVATDHAPHGSCCKSCTFAAARPGMLGLQTSLPIIAKVLQEITGTVDWKFVAQVMSKKPAEIGKLPDQGREIIPGEPANIVLVNPNSSWIVRKENMLSGSDNTPYEQSNMPVSIALTLLRGKVTHNAENHRWGKPSPTVGGQ